MRFIRLFLIGYFVLVIVVGLALWQTGVLRQIHLKAVVKNFFAFNDAKK